MKRRAIKVKKKPATSIELSQPRRVWFAAGDALQRDGREHLRCQRLFAGVTIDLGRLGWRCKTGRNWRVAGAAAEPTGKRTAKDDEHCAPQHAPAPSISPAMAAARRPRRNLTRPHRAGKRKKRSQSTCPESASARKCRNDARWPQRSPRPSAKLGPR